MSRATDRGVLTYIKKHPLYALEHLALTCLVFLYLSGHFTASSRSERILASGESLPRHSVTYNQCQEGDTYCCCPAGGSGSFSVFNQKGVEKAPAQTLSMDQLPVGQASSHHDMRGDIWKFKMSDNITINLMRTEAGTMRSGDLHNCTQMDIILKGNAILRRLDVLSGSEVVREYGANDFIMIPPRIPHLFEFVEENYMVEWWDCPFEAWYYKPYRDRISQSMSGSKKATNT